VRYRCQAYRSSEIFLNGVMLDEHMTGKSVAQQEPDLANPTMSRPRLSHSLFSDCQSLGGAPVPTRSAPELGTVLYGSISI
jgi:hypothetical protein